MAANQNDNIKALKARVTQLEAELKWMQPKPAESYTAWVERLFHTVRKVA
jgi:BMFP domain-containing protein YqiC